MQSQAIAATNLCQWWEMMLAEIWSGTSFSCVMGKIVQVAEKEIAKSTDARKG